MTLYMIVWIATVTGATGHGECLKLPYAVVQHIANELTIESGGLLEHYVVKCERGADA